MMQLSVKNGFKVGSHFGLTAIFRDGCGSPVFLFEYVQKTGMIKMISVNGLRHKTVIKGSQSEIQTKLDEILALR